MIVTIFDEVFKALHEKKPILLLGAGFSNGAKNYKNKPLLLGKSLAYSLYNHFFIDKNIGKDFPESITQNIKDRAKDLKKICTTLRSFDKTMERNEVLTDAFSGAFIGDDDPRRYIVNYPWSAIFTLNIDNLVENIYTDAGKKLSVFDLTHPYQKKEDGNTSLIKLHGSVGHPEAGYVFDDEEYRQFSLQENSSLREFAHLALENSVIMIGTEFQEDDLLFILSTYEACGYQNQNKRFYITPKINNPDLYLKIQNSKNDIWIQREATDFFCELHSQVIEPETQKKKLEEYGVVFLSSLSRTKPTTYGLYKGEPSLYEDFFHEADIKHPKAEEWKNDVVNSSSNRQLFTFYGLDYTGKTCCAKRLLVDLYDDGYECLSLRSFSDQLKSLLIQYFKTNKATKKVAVYIDAAAYFYSEIIDFMAECPDSVEKLIIITEDTTDNHETWRYHLLKDESHKEYAIEPTMSRPIAISVYDKLSRNKRLGYYLKLLPDGTNPFSSNSRKEIVNKIIQEKDIIDALYYSSEGRSFQDHYRSWLKKSKDESELKLLNQLCCLSALGIKRIQKPLLVQIARTNSIQFRYDEFCKRYKDVLCYDGAFIGLKRCRILQPLLPEITVSEIIEAIRLTALYNIPSSEHEKTERNSIFEKALRVKRIRKNEILRIEEISNLLSDIEKKCSNISYYWVQRGIASQLLNEFEDANNHLLYARKLRENSYQVRHALGKNNMEWGIKLVEQGNIMKGYLKFSEGEDELRELTYNKKFSDNFKYSVHTLVDTKLRMSIQSGRKMTFEECKEIESLLKKILEGNLDNRLSSVIKRFIHYCKDNKYTEIAYPLQNVYRKPLSYNATSEAYDDM